MKQTRNKNLKEFWFHTGLTPIKHNRYKRDETNEYLITFCGLYSNGVLQIGISFCNVTLEKHYNRRLGNVIAYGRALKRPSSIRNIGAGVVFPIPNKELYDYFKMCCEALLVTPQKHLWNVNLNSKSLIK